MEFKKNMNTNFDSSVQKQYHQSLKNEIGIIDTYDDNIVTPCSK